MSKPRKRRSFGALLLIVILPAVLLGVVQLDRSFADWITAGEAPLDLSMQMTKPLAITTEWSSHEALEKPSHEMRTATLRLDMPDARSRTLVVRSNNPIQFLSINGRLAGVVNKPEMLQGTLIALPPQVGTMVVEVAVLEPSSVPTPLLILGTEREISSLTSRRVITVTVFLTLVLTSALVILMNYLWQGKKLHMLALWLAYMLLVLSQVDLFMPQMMESEILHQTAMLLLSAALCCAASLRLEGQNEGPLLLGLLIADSLLALLWIGGYIVLNDAPLFWLAKPMQGVGIVLTAAFAVFGIIQSGKNGGSTERLENIALLLQLVGLSADLVLPRNQTLVLVPVLVFAGAMSGVHLWLAARQQAEDRHNSELLERQLEQRVEQRTEELRFANQQLSRIDASRGEFFSHIAHDLQSPLTIIRGSLDLVIDGMPATEEEREGYLEMAKSSVIKLTNRIKALRGLALMDENEYQPEKQALAPLMETCMDNWRAMYRTNEITFAAEGDDDVEAMFDISWLQSALERLVSNAIRYTPPGGHITVAWERVQFGVNISVTDTGCGIAEQDLPTLFDRFYQGWNSRDGLGIGLAVVQRVVQRHGGRVTVRSAPGQGATFTMFFPDLPAGTWTPPAAREA